MLGMSKSRTFSTGATKHKAEKKFGINNLGFREEFVS
jgi:hypothetical protein